jgi:hypothetical protein
MPVVADLASVVAAGEKENHFARASQEIAEETSSRTLWSWRFWGQDTDRVRILPTVPKVVANITE